jgi:DNA-binding MarR family transcriptional regulator
MEELSEIELKILYYLYHSGSAFIKKLASRLNEDIHTISGLIKKLESSGYLDRVAGTMVDYRIDRRNRVKKHRNHTYYDLTRKGRLFMRNFRGRPEINLRPPYKQV